MGKTIRMNRKRRKGNVQIRCPYCGSNAVYKSADGIYKDNSGNKMLYVCSNYPECDSYVRVIEGTKKPIGSLANKELRKLRSDAHYYFDKLYQNGYMTKEEAYRWLADIIDSPYLANAHIGNMSDYYCRLVIEKSRDFIKAKQRVKSNEPYHKIAGRQGFAVIGGGRNETGQKAKAVG